MKDFANLYEPFNYSRFLFFHLQSLLQITLCTLALPCKLILMCDSTAPSNTAGKPGSEANMVANA